MKDYYRILDLSPDASQKEIKEAYRLLALVWHPDRFPKGSKARKLAEEKFKEINEANEILSDPAKRKEYDEKSGFVVRPPKPVISPTMIDFGEIEQGEVAHREFTVDNQGGEPKEDVKINYPPDSWFSVERVAPVAFPFKVPVWVDSSKLLPGRSYRGTITVDMDGVKAAVEVLLRVVEAQEEALSSSAPDPIDPANASVDSYIALASWAVKLWLVLGVVFQGAFVMLGCRGSDIGIQGSFAFPIIFLIIYVLLKHVEEDARS